jgi:hypothetical protein
VTAPDLLPTAVDVDGSAVDVFFGGDTDTALAKLRTRYSDVPPDRPDRECRRPTRHTRHAPHPHVTLRNQLLDRSESADAFGVEPRSRLRLIEHHSPPGLGGLESSPPLRPLTAPFR